MSDDLGWELVVAAHKSDIHSEDDVVVTFIHWRLLFEAGLRCVGLGENFSSASEDANLAEVMPNGWSKETPYCLRYRAKSKPTEKYLLKVVKVEDAIVATLVRISDEKVATVSLKPADEANKEQMTVKNKENLVKKISNDLLKDMFPLAKPAGSATVEKPESSIRQEPRPDPLRVGPPQYPEAHPDPLREFPPRLGGSDLDPFGRMGRGGMIVDPSSMGGGRGRGGGPQFDPVNPFVPNPMGRGGSRGGRRYYGDEMPPPDFDNMFG